jgi:autotransporter-associated beta strand protein
MEKGSITYFNGPNTYSGGTTPAQGIIAFGLSSSGSPTVTSGPIGTGPLLLNLDSSSELLASGMIEASVPDVTIANAIQCVSGTNNLTLQVGGSNNLTLAGPFTLNGNDGLTTNTITSRYVQATNSGLTTISGVISDGGKNYGFGSVGIGVLALNNTETYTGPTVVSNGTLLVNGQIGSGAVTVATNATLGGSGTINGAVTVLNGGNLAAGDQTIGTLTINNTLTFQAGSTNIVYVNGSGNSSKVAATSETYAGTLDPVITSGTLTAGQNFTIFSGSATGNFTVAGTPGPGLSWQFTPSTGVLSVVGGAPVIPNVPPRITNVSISGGNVTITATNGVNGGTYYLLGTTNLSTRPVVWVPVATNVVTASGGSGTFSFAGTNAYPAGFPMWFFTLSSTNN